MHYSAHRAVLTCILKQIDSNAKKQKKASIMGAFL